MGKFNYQMMLIRLKISFFLKEKFIRKMISRKDEEPGSLFMNKIDNKELGKLSGRPGEYRIHVNKEQITQFLN